MLYCNRNQGNDFNFPKQVCARAQKMRGIDMDMFSFLNNGVLFCMMNAKKNMEIEENEYMD